jgi:hypothetical protein
LSSKTKPRANKNSRKTREKLFSKTNHKQTKILSKKTWFSLPLCLIADLDIPASVDTATSTVKDVDRMAKILQKLFCDGKTRCSGEFRVARGQCYDLGDFLPHSVKKN